MKLTAATWDVLAFGAVAVDDILYVDNFPSPDTKIHVRERIREGGGRAGTGLVAAARLGARTAYAGVWGDDELSQYSREQMEMEGVDCSPVVCESGKQPYYSVIVVDRSQGTRCILSCTDNVVGYPVDRITDELIARARVVLIDHMSIPASLRAAQIAREHHIPVVADIERIGLEDFEELLEAIDHLIVSADFARAVTGSDDPVTMLRELGTWRACCAVTMGERGCWYTAGDDEVRHQPALQVETVDTTGCGDVFHGAYAAWLARGESVAAALCAASITAGLKATQPGGRRGIPDRATVEKWMASDARR